MKKAGSFMGMLALCCSLSGCLGGLIPDPDKEAQDIENEAAATGAACRQSGRSLEECFERNDSMNRTGALRGWKDMDDYMRQNKLDPQVPPPKAKEESHGEEGDAKKNKEPGSLGKSKDKEDMEKPSAKGGHESGDHGNEAGKPKKKSEKNEAGNQKVVKDEKPGSHLQEKIKEMNNGK